MQSYNKRIWLNSMKSDSTGSVVAFVGNVKYRGKKVLDAFLEIADCHNKVRLHLTTDDTLSDFIEKMKLLRNEIDKFINHLEKDHGTKSSKS